MKIDYRLIIIAALVAVVVVLVLSQRGCGNSTIEVDRKFVYDSLERVIISRLPKPDTIKIVEEKEVVRWLPNSMVVDTVYIGGDTTYIYNLSEIDTAAILTHYLSQSVTYTDTIRDSSLQAVIQDTIFRNALVGRGFTYKILRPTEIQYIDNRDKFQFIASLQFGASATYTNQLNGVYGGADIGLKFRSGTYFSLGYMAGTSHFATIRVGQVIRLKRKR